MKTIVLSLLVSICAIGQNYRPGEVIVKLKGKSSSLTSHAFLGKMVSKGISLKGSFSHFNMYHFSTKAGQSEQQLINELEQDPHVEYVEPNFYLRKMNVDEEISKVRYLRSDFEDLTPDGFASPQQSVAELNREDLLNTMSSSNSDYVPVVAVIDTGVDIYHEVFQNSDAIWVNENEIPGNGIDDDNNGYIDDVNGWNFYANTPNPTDEDGHGTHVAGIVLGVGLDIFASQVETSRIKIMPLKFLGPGGAGTTSDAIAALHYAIMNGADVLNNSWGGPDWSTALLDAVDLSYQRGLVFVGAAGNSGSNNDNLPMYPASLSVPHVMSVASTNDWDNLATFSNYGKETVDLGSPGVAIFSTFPGDTFGYSSGTSMSAPFVAGLAALMLIENPDLNGFEVRDIIFGEADPLSHLEDKLSTGSKVNLGRSVREAQSAEGGIELPDYDPSTEPNRGVASSSSSSSSDVPASGCGMATYLAQFKGPGSPPSGRPPFFGLLVLFVLVPLVLARVYSATMSSPASRRRHDRYVMDSEVKINVGGKELVGNIGTISLGGVSLNTEALLEHGGIVKMQIAGPEGEGSIEVEGQVVWSEAGKSYGVQFAETEDGIRQTIQNWTSGLVKSS